MNNKVILVTGASSGIGAAIASRLAADGHLVFGTARQPAANAPGNTPLLALDVCSDSSVRACVEHVLGRAGRIDAVINNAGYLLAGAIEGVTIEAARNQFETNFFGIVRVTQAVLPAMRQQRSGQIVNISSLAGLVAMPFWGFYNASKAAVELFSESLRTELKPFGIHVSLVEPGAIKTPFYGQPAPPGMAEYAPWSERARKALKRFEDRAPGPEVVAALVSKIVASKSPPLRNTVTLEGMMLPLLRRLTPQRAFETVSRFVFKLDRD